MSKKWKKVKRLLASVMALLLTFSVMTSAQVHAETPEETKRLSVSGEGSGSIYITDSSGRSSVNETFTKEYLAGDEISLEIQAEEGNSIGSISVNGNALEGVPEGLDTCTYQYVISDETEINVVFKDNPAAQTETQTAEATTAEEEDTGLTPPAKMRTLK